MSSNIHKTKEYFDANPTHFKHAVEEYPIMYREAAERINKHIKGNVLDIGSGGILNYDTKKAKNVFLVDITTANKERAGKNIIFMNSDMRNLGIRDEKIDIVIMQHLLHHLADNTLQKTLRNLEEGFKETQRVVKKEGKIMIVEGCVPLTFDYLQRALFPLNKRLYKWLFSFPMVLQYSKEKIVRELKKAGFEIESVEVIKDGDILPIFGLNLPRKYIPLKHYCIIAKKN
ncbi:MAG: class I SAM-dependent methyltransferase [Nanoarchaeota archaeon]